MRMKLCCCAAVLALLAAPSPSQTAHVYYGLVVTDNGLPNTACAPTVPQIPAYATPPLPLLAPPFGGHAINQATNVVYVSTGPTISMMAHPLYAPTIPVFPGPVPPAVVPCPPGALFGPITGMAAAAIPGIAPAGILFVTDGLCIMGLLGAPPYPVVVPPWPAPVVAAGGPLTGLEFDSTTGTLWACDLIGFSYNLPIGGVVPLAVFPPPPGLLGPVVGNVVDRSVVPPAVYVTEGLALHPVFPPGPPIPIPAPAIAPAYGASFSAEPVVLPGSCACGGVTPAIGTTIPIVAGIPTFGVTIAGAIPGSVGYLGLDAACIPGGFVFGAACTWWLPLPPSSLIGPIPLPGGAAVVPLGALPPPFIGFVAYAQWAVLCPAFPGVQTTDALHLRLSAL